MKVLLSDFKLNYINLEKKLCLLHFIKEFYITIRNKKALLNQRN